MCGIVGIIGTPNAAKESYLGLLMLQHRGQDSAGILSFNPKNLEFNFDKNLGHIKEALNEKAISKTQAEMSIAHTRYSTIGHVRKEEIQPMFMSYPYGLGMVHNGNIINADEVKTSLLAQKNRFVLTKNDLEVMMNIMAQSLSENPQIAEFEKIQKATQTIYDNIKGGYSLISIIAGHGLLAAKDPNGIRPLVWGRRKLSSAERAQTLHQNEFSYAVASESNTLNFLGYENIIELEAGEILYINEKGKIYNKKLNENMARPCMFEWIYFANADSTIWNQNVYSTRLELGRKLGEKINKLGFDIDMVVPVPDTSRPSAITISEVIKKPYREVLIKNRYTQRTFILNNQEDREKVIKLKLSVVSELIRDKNVLLVDDSIVRGTTSKRIIKLLKDNGARNVYIASTCPPIINPCFYGIDFPTKEELVANDKNYVEIAKTIGATEVIYLDLAEFKKVFPKTNNCMACLDGNYPVKIENREGIKRARINNEKTELPRFC